MNDSHDSCSCQVKLELKSAIDKLTFLRDHWPVFGQPESIDNLSDTELQCILCLLDDILEAVVNEEYICSNREALKLEITRTLVANHLQLREYEQLKSELEKEIVHKFTGDVQKMKG